MKTSLKLAATLVNLLIKVERQSIDYLEVLAHKADSPQLKAQLLSFISGNRKKIKHLKQLPDQMNLAVEVGSIDGAKGIISEGFQLIEKYPSSTYRDGTILHTTILLSQHKLGKYRLLLRHCQLLRKEYEVYLIQASMAEEEAILTRLMKLLDANIRSSIPVFPLRARTSEPVLSTSL
ncbi:MAG: DUF892 family protein [Bacteroidota bacterium]